MKTSAYWKSGSLISAGDFIDLFWKIRNKGFRTLYFLFHFSNQARTAIKWNANTSTSDFWIIPEVRRRWNEKCTGNPALEYEDYVVATYFSGLSGLRMLSVGCGTGARERKFARYPTFDLIEGIDMAGKLVEEARENARRMNLSNLRYHEGDFEKHTFQPGSFDVILFNSSLHHFDNINRLMQGKIKPLLKKGGFLLLFEYVGPKRLQWTDFQLKFANEVLKSLPDKYKLRFRSHSAKRKIYRPGLWRMCFVDPSEAVDSESIISSVHNHFGTLEEKLLGWDITHLVFKDIAHNFIADDRETKSLISYVFEKEDHYMSVTGRSDAIFGVYQK